MWNIEWIYVYTIRIGEKPILQRKKAVSYLVTFPLYMTGEVEGVFGRGGHDSGNGPRGMEVSNIVYYVYNAKDATSLEHVFQI